MKKRILSILLALVMALSLLPTTVLAANEEPASVKYGTYGSSTVWTEDEKCAGSIVYEDKGVKLSKVATPTANDNEYEITLTVETTTTSSTTAASAATVLVIDTSGSMDYCAECGKEIMSSMSHEKNCSYYGKMVGNGLGAYHEYESRMDAAKAAAEVFLAAYSGRTKNSADTLNYGRYLAIVPFSTNVGTTTGWLDVSNKADYDEADRAINNLNANGGTNLERGLYTANEKLKDNAVKDISNKNVIALTDGEPTYYGTTPNGGGSYCDEDTYKATINTATALKENATLYTVCFGVANERMKKSYDEWTGRYDYWDITVGDYLENNIANADCAYNAENTDALNEAFKNITKTITSGISAGTVNDPLPAGGVVTAGIGYAKTWELDPDDAERTVEGNTTTYTYTKTYTVTIDPGQVVDGTDYQPLNGKTTFTSGDTVLEFPVPAGKVTPITYTVKYEYTGTVPADATELPGEDTCRYGDTVTVAAGATATGYTFSGWTTSDADIEDGRFTMPNKDVTLTGSFTINNYTVTYRVDDKTYGSPESYNYGADVTVAQTPSEEGYTFNGWTTEDVTVTSGKFTMPDKDVTLSGKFSPRTDLSYTVNYLEQSTNKVLADAKTVTGQTFGASVTETAIDITGYTKVDPISATIAIGVENNVINFYYALSATPLDPTTFGVKYFVEYYLEDAETGAFVKNETRSTIKAAEVTRDGTTTVTETPAVIEGYAFDVEKSSISGTVKLPKSDADIVTLKLYYGIDNWNDKEDKDDKGDGIPDYKQVRILYTATTGGSVDPTISIITLSETTGNVTDAGSTATAKSGYQFDKWTREDTTVATTATTGAITIANAEGGKTYTFTANFARKSTPYNPPVAPKLNKADHYAYVVGYPDGTVQPQGAITRAEVATIFFRLLSDETRDLYWTKDNGYTDVKVGDWFNNAVSTLSNAGIINGYPDGTFRPNAPITRAEMAKVIAMFAELNKDSAGFKDIAGHWAEAYIKLAAGNGWIAGYPDGTFRPDQDITRAETMTMINRVLERVPSTEKHLLAYEVMLTFPDNQPGDWYYIAVQEATNSHTYERYATEKNGDEQWIKLIDNYDWTKLEF